MTWIYLHSAVSLTLTGVAIFMLSRWRQRYTLTERLGLGVMGGCGLLRVNVIWEMRESPFFDWSPTLAVLGMLLFVSGRAWRDRKHEWANREQEKIARESLARRGIHV